MRGKGPGNYYPIPARQPVFFKKYIFSSPYIFFFCCFLSEEKEKEEEK